MKHSEWEQIKAEFMPIVKKVGYKVYRNQMYKDNIYDVDDLIQVGMIKLEECYKLYSDKPLEDFKSLAYVSIKRELWNVCKPDTHTTPLDEIKANTIEAPVTFSDGDIELPEKLEQLCKFLKYKHSKAVLNELLNPSEATINLAKADIEAKQKLADAGKNVRVPRTLDIKQRYIREALGLSTKQFDKAIKEVREVAMYVFELEDNFLR